ncbi:MAG: hypothetical protein GF353_13970 [Candidatus Lokiarchaeota archaeon]|nr:hypothetical protein [Candidatus Lokiarchaeota archaeon]
MKIVVKNKNISRKDFEKHFQLLFHSNLLSNNNISYSITETKLRSVDSSVLMVLVSSSGVVLTTLISWLFKLAITKGSQKIVIQGKNGKKIEVPAGTSEKDIDKFLEKASKLSVDSIFIE